MRDPACMWLIVENAKIFKNYLKVMLKIFEFSHVKVIAES